MKNRSEPHSSTGKSAINSLERVKEILLADFTNQNELRLKKLEEQFKEALDGLTEQNKELAQRLTTFIETEINKISTENERRFKNLQRVDADLEKKLQSLSTELADLTRLISREKSESRRLIDSLNVQLSIIKKKEETDNASLAGAIQRNSDKLKEQNNRIATEKETVLKMLTIRYDDLAKEVELNRKNEINQRKEMEARLAASIEAIKRLI